MKFSARTWITAVRLSAVLAIPARSIAQNKVDHKPIITTFDVPGALGRGSIDPSDAHDHQHYLHHSGRHRKPQPATGDETAPQSNLTYAIIARPIDPKTHPESSPRAPPGP